MAKVIAFVSYAHADEEDDEGGTFYYALQIDRAVALHTARSFAFFVDRKSIEWGDAWRARIADGLTDSAILITFLTPNYLASDECRKEIESFLTLRGERWLLPIYYINVPEFNVPDFSMG